MWAGFQWPVSRLQAGQDFPVLRLLAHSINDSHHKNAYIENAALNKIYRMKQRFDLLQTMREDRRPRSDVEVGMACNDGKINNVWTESVQKFVRIAQTGTRMNTTVCRL